MPTEHFFTRQGLAGVTLAAVLIMLLSHAESGMARHPDEGRAIVGPSLSQPRYAISPDDGIARAQMASSLGMWNRVFQSFCLIGGCDRIR